MGVAESELVSRVLGCDLEIAVATFPAFWDQHEHLSRLELCPVDIPSSQWPVFAVFETLSDGKASHRYERARISFSRHGSDDEGCVLDVRGSALKDFRSDGWGVFYPRSLPTVSPRTIKSIPDQYALYLAQQDIVPLDETELSSSVVTAEVMEPQDSEPWMRIPDRRWHRTALKCGGTATRRQKSHFKFP